MTSEHQLDDHPMIEVAVLTGSTHGWMRLSGIWGDSRVFSKHKIPGETLVDFFCPRCNSELRSARQCPDCDAPMVTLLNKNGGMISLCSRRGCQEHMLDLG